jgi:hypothetical protein
MVVEEIGYGDGKVYRAEAEEISKESAAGGWGLQCQGLVLR